MKQDVCTKTGLQVPSILMPAAHVDLHAWSVIACDQYTSQPEYWDEVERAVGEKPSTLRLIYPEIYLNAPDREARIARVHRTMQDYLDQGLLVEQPQALYLVKRTTETTGTRWGLLAALDLEQYDYRKNAKSLIRATEGTIIDRIPPRMEIRKGAPIELPHILVLIDDPKHLLIEPFTRTTDTLEQMYSFTLMKGGGEIACWRIGDPALISQAEDALLELSREAGGSPASDALLYAVGDGNHSLATAKACWEEIKRSAENPDTVMNHPARWALVELENIHDPGLTFEPIYRVLFDAQREALEPYFSHVCKSWEFSPCSDAAEALSKTDCGDTEVHVVGYADERGFGHYRFTNPVSTIAVGTLQEALDRYLADHPESAIDYVHGEEAARTLGQRPGCCAFFLPTVDKHTFFEAVRVDGALPRKTFSMGEAHEKRYYIEARRIIP